MDTKGHLILVSIILCWLLHNVSTFTTEVQLERVDITADEGYMQYDVRVRKMNRTTHTLNGTWSLLKDADGSYEMAQSFAYSTLGNNQFNEYPMKLPRKRVCQYMVEEYRDRQYLWSDSSNMPRVEEGATEYCPFPKGDYWIKDLVLDSSWIPSVVPTGLWRFTTTFWCNGDVVVQSVLYLRLSRNL